MPAVRFAVEAVRGNVAILSNAQDVDRVIGQYAEKHNLETHHYSLDQMLGFTDQSFPVHDAWLIFLTPELASFFVGEGRGVWSKLTSYPHPHLYLVERAWQKIPLEVSSRATRLVVGEYLGLDGEGSPTLASLEQAISGMNPVSLGEGGLSALHLMSEEYLVNAIVRALVSQTEAPQINIGNTSGVSLVTLLQLITESQSSRVEVTYSDDGIVSPVSPSFYRSTHQLLSDLPKESTLDLAISYLKEQKPKDDPTPKTEPVVVSLPDPEPEPEQVLVKEQVITLPKTRLPKLVRTTESEPAKPKTYNLTGLEFVPKKQPRVKKKLTVPSFLKKRGLRVVAKGLLFGLIFYLGSLALTLGITWVTITNYKNQLVAGSLDNLKSNPVAKTAAKYLYTNSVAFGLTDASLLLDAYQQALKLGETTSNLSLGAREISSYILSDVDLNLASTLTTARLDVETLYQELSLLDGTLPAKTPDLLTSVDDDYQNFKNLLPTLKKNTLLGKGVVSILPDLISLSDRAKYLVLFQNNMELRGTGGFIGSYGIISFEKGKLYDFQVYDVYTADGALKGHVEPPAPIKNILGEAKWYLRDSNFDPDFPTSARRAEWFLKKSMNQDVSGTIAVNLETLKLLLSAIGPLELPDYDETINAGNLAERAQYHAEVNFFPGSTAKKEFLSSVADALFEKIKTADAKSLLSVSAALMSSLESSDTQVSVTSPNSERILQTLGWNGGIENKPCPTSPCYDDYLYSVDSNFGVNKANFYITKDMNLEISVSKDGEPTHTLTTTWKNAATSNAWPAGSYKNYARLYLPPSSSLVEIRVGENALSPSDYTVAEEHGRLVISYLVTVPINSLTTSTVVYTNRTQVKSGSFYTLYYQRQSGTRSQDKLTVNYNLPLYLKPSKLSPEPSVLDSQKLRFDFLNDTDHRLSIQF